MYNLFEIVVIVGRAFDMSVDPVYATESKGIGRDLSYFGMLKVNRFRLFSEGLLFLYMLHNILGF